MKAFSSPGDLDGLARTLVLEVATGRLLGHLFPDEPARLERPGRYAALERVIAADATLRQALVHDDHDDISKAWKGRLRGRSDDVDLLHTLAVLYRERALLRASRTGDPGDLLVTATGLWVLLLATPRFWERFGGEADEAGLRAELARELLGLHAAHGARALEAGRTDDARLHMRCLDACRSGTSRIRGLLDGASLRYRLTVDRGRLREISDLAAGLIERWCSDVVDGAERRVKDPETAERLPEGVSGDYESGISRLEPLVELDVSAPRVLSTGLGWFNDWAYDMYRLKKTDKIKKVVASARAFADRLAPLCAQGHGHRVENQVLSKHFMYRGFTTDDHDQATRDYETALEWNPANGNASELLAQRVIRHGQDLAHEGKIKEALRIGEKARRFAADDPDIDAFIREMRDMAPEEETLKALSAAERELRQKRFGGALNALAGIRVDSRFAQEAQQLRMAAYLNRGIETINNASQDPAPRPSRSRLGDYGLGDLGLPDLDIPGLGRLPGRAHSAAFHRAIADIRNALGLATEPDDRKFVRKQLSAALNARAVSELNTLQESALGALHGISPTAREAREWLEEAIRLDPGNTMAKQNLRTVKEMLRAW